MGPRGSCACVAVAAPRAWPGPHRSSPFSFGLPRRAGSLRSAGRRSGGSALGWVRREAAASGRSGRCRRSRSGPFVQPALRGPGTRRRRASWLGSGSRPRSGGDGPGKAPVLRGTGVEAVRGTSLRGGEPGPLVGAAPVKGGKTKELRVVVFGVFFCGVFFWLQETGCVEFLYHHQCL